MNSSNVIAARGLLRIGMIGLGKTGAVHFRHLQEMEGVEVVAIAEVNPANRPENLDEIRYGTDYREIIAAEDVDAVVISLPHILHKEAAEAALLSGKHVFLEKPIATVYEDAAGLVHLAEKVGRTLMINMTHRFYPPMRKGKELLESGALGEVVAIRDYYMEVINRAEFPAWFFDPIAAGGGVAVTDTIHLIDRVEWLIGEKLRTLGVHGRRLDPSVEVEDCVEFLCASESGVPITIGSFFCFDGPTTRGDGLTVFGTRGVMTIYAWSHVEWTPYGGKTERFDGYPAGLDQPACAAIGHRAAITEFIEAVFEERVPASEGKAVLHAQAVVQDFYRFYPSESFYHGATQPTAQLQPFGVYNGNSPESVIRELEGLKVVNTVGYATRVGGSSPSDGVLDAMRWAQGHYFELDDLMSFSSRRIAAATASEAGFVTCGAGAALTLGAAAILAGFNINAMEQLPDTSGMTRVEFLYPEPNYFDYDHPVRASGAKLAPFAFDDDEKLEERLSAAIKPETVGVVFVWKSRHQRALIKRIGDFCKKAGLPFLLDAAMALPPAENLTDFYSLGANLVALSGGKHLGGPQNSGLLFGDKGLVMSAWLQMVDMHVQPDAWGLRELISSGVIPKPPRHGIGRGFKVGKDVIVGCLVALEHYATRDFAAERARWEVICANIAANVKESDDFCVESLGENVTGQYPVIRITAVTKDRMTAFKRSLRGCAPKIITAEDDDLGNVAYLYPMALSDEEVTIVINRMNEAIKA